MQKKKKLNKVIILIKVHKINNKLKLKKRIKNNKKCRMMNGRISTIKIKIKRK